MSIEWNLDGGHVLPMALHVIPCVKNQRVTSPKSASEIVRFNESTLFSFRLHNIIILCKQFGNIGRLGRHN